MNNLETPLAMLYHWEQTNPDKILFKQPINGEWRTFTWKEAAAEVRKMAAVLQGYNFPPQSKIGLVSKNCAHWIMADLAIMMAGHISVPIYPNVGADTLNYVLKHSEAQLLFVGKLDDWNFMKAGVPEGVECISFPWYGPKQEGFKYWDELSTTVTPVSGQPDRALSDVMTIIYTSGTTGNPKGVVHSYRNFAYAINVGKAYFGLNYGEDRLFSYLPLSHIAERLLIEMAGLYVNAEIWFAESLDLFVTNLAEAQPTIFLAVPRIWTKFQMGILAKLPQSWLSLLLSIPIINNIIRNKVKAGLGLAKGRHYLTGAAPIPASLVQWWEKLGVEIEEVYGMTENCAVSHCNKKPQFKVGTQGRPFPGTEVKFSDVGEILVKVESNMLEYYKEPEMTAQTLKDGWLYTGDKGETDADGFLRITGRVKEIFKTDKGKYVAPAPIEMKLSKNLHIEQLCVVGANLPQPMVLVVLSADAKGKEISEVKESLEETLKIVNEKLEKHERLHKLVIVKEDWTIENSLLTPSLKIKRDPLEKKYSPHYEKWYAADGYVLVE